MSASIVVIARHAIPVQGSGGSNGGPALPEFVEVRQAPEAAPQAEAPAVIRQSDGTTVIEQGGVRTTITQGPDGVRIMHDGEEIVTVPSSGVPSDPMDNLDLSNVVPDGAVTIAIAFFVAIAAMVIGLPISRGIARRMDRTPVAPPLSPEFRSELAGLQEAVSSVAVEIERVAETQRWTARQLGAQPGSVR